MFNFYLLKVQIISNFLLETTIKVDDLNFFSNNYCRNKIIIITPHTTWLHSESKIDNPNFYK